jgi:hypothetical protein
MSSSFVSLFRRSETFHFKDRIRDSVDRVLTERIFTFQATVNILSSLLINIHLFDFKTGPIYSNPKTRQELKFEVKNAKSQSSKALQGLLWPIEA